MLATESQFPEHVAQSVLVLINESETCEPISESTLFLSAEAIAQPISIRNGTHRLTAFRRSVTIRWL